ncbi:acyl-CoA carboxylase subunit epsilon [Georgenia yuyongxinii]|uniref:acyl-CoA carboxylase subunit epsilon n=1 Tax=Georgenia yuyongxinii TaxID=2589797 RepID=UPI001E344135|nr:acyl-CoA carboxylase subunit epsilon [Georgenia yuyongxinii]
MSTSGLAMPPQDAPTSVSPAEWSSGGEDDVVAAALDASDRAALDAGPALMTSPAVRVLRGRPDEVELAALVAGIVAARGRADELGGLPDEAAECVRSRWSERARVLGMATAPDAGAWRWSLHP